ncbi:hypothetical protein LX97_03012 [Nonlabens dokdonensis]|jgi:hypothetical protein|uniref:Uncharacterized protein n=2 Tax=Nonlabens dokdonensis TaxID=328515 RepID=L7W8Z4_NONDD|nr:hypothetical protein [Nonlabens dokdonensis]AGC78190.1 hypothetical protein DDD_3063 [Nonlabens dokdonensis DSW-6]PZX37917.1 hypothetical protein LX97_03012 [Nonlabens dokdonensis]
MTVKDLFRLVFKSIGLGVFFYSTINIFALIGPLLYTEEKTHFFLYLAGSLLALILVYLLFFVFIDRLISILKLDQGFDSQVVHLGEISTSKVFEIVLFTLGMINIVSVLPDFAHWFFMKFQSDVSHQSTDLYVQINNYDIAYNCCYLAIGVLVILLRKQIVKLLE